MKKLMAWMLMVLLLFACAQAETTDVFVRMGGSFGLAMDSNGVIWGWGDNRNGQLGLETRKVIATPVQAAAGLDGREILDIQCGNVNTLFVMKDGTVYTCGSDGDGQQGLANVKDRVLVPVQIPGLENIVQVNCGFGHCMALDRDGHVWAWGRNHVGQVGNGERKRVDTPVMLGLEQIVQISCGGKYSMALDAQGVVWGWGEGDYGQLGGKKINYQVEPKVVDLGERKVVEIACGGDTSYFRCEDGTVWAMGRNDFWQLGRDDVRDGYSAQPVQVALPEDVKAVRIIAYNSHAMVLTEDGQLWGWGLARSGQLGVGDRPSKKMPLLACEQVADADVGSLASVVMLQDGTVMATGLNKYAQIGTRYKKNGIVAEWLVNGMNLLTGVCEPVK